MNIHGFHHLAIQARDVEWVAEFYREVLGLPELARHHREDGSVRSIWLSVGGGDGGFLAVEEAKPEAGGAEGDGLGFSLLALRIRKEDKLAILEELRRRGVPVERQSQWTAYFCDPEGNRIGLSHHPD